MTITRIHHLNCASIQGISLLGQHLVCHVLLLETTDAGLVLVDTGLGSADYADISSRLGWEFAKVYARPGLDPSLAAVEQIRELGFSVSDVRHIVQTHLDLDHVGGLSDFPQALVHVHATELDAARRRHGLRAKRRYRPKMWTHDPKWRTYTHGGEGWMGFDAVRGLEGLGDDILMVPLFGHTHGHCGIAVNTSDGWLLDAGDAYFDAREIKLPQRRCGAGVALFQMMVTTERANRRHNQDRLRSLHADHPEVDIFCAHNPFEYLDLAERNGDTPRGIATARAWKPDNRSVGSARTSGSSMEAK
ncbi:MBL fold metallo-hydrolase [Mycobacterium sp. Aquia_216]|uniref:MBL fold metallo-hydrolase n=1 Tax=Mycobacterium sp. Aquia_216 TaxID=2991729 RepID=UPI00227CE6A0|nr:MBL fold metallo-hydrolase [Mycobacterium sp. Aquia_216]WAJ45064.1 MBL fold metallo-hydrolase [Mycobacterium sp. Aquia_216]